MRVLDGKGLVTRRTDPDHAKRVLVALSPAGVAAYSDLAIVVHEAQAEVFAALDRTRREELVALLRRDPVADVLEDHARQPPGTCPVDA